MTIYSVTDEVRFDGPRNFLGERQQPLARRLSSIGREVFLYPQTATEEMEMEFKKGDKLTGAQSLIYSLEQEGVQHIFGIPGGAILPAYDPLIDSSIRHVLCRHEQGAGHAAEGYAWATGKVGVAIATSGPGGCNLVTALADAKMDSVPIVAITGQVPTP